MKVRKTRCSDLYLNDKIGPSQTYTDLFFTLMRYHEGLIAIELQSRTSVAPHEIFVRILAK